MMWTYLIIAVVLLSAELVYFKIADKFNIIDKPNERSSHKTIVLRGGGVIFPISMIVWMILGIVQGFNGSTVQEYVPFIIGLVLIAGVSFVDDIHSLPDSVRLVAHFTSIGLLIWQLFYAAPDSVIGTSEWWIKLLFVLASLVVCVGATNIINFMDGINGITAGYSLAVLIPLVIENGKLKIENGVEFIEPSYLIVAIIGVLVFSIFNFRPRGKAKCFAGDVGSVGIAYIMLLGIGMLIMATGDLTWLMFLVVYGIDGCCTIVHRIMLHENLGEAHRKHAYQLMANELGVSHVVVSLIYMGLQLVISLVMIYLVPNTIMAHWVYAVVVMLLLIMAYVLFMKKYYHLHEEYLRSLSSNS